jgi:uncharacterized repeat protein (TIGR03803 family)
MLRRPGLRKFFETACAAALMSAAPLVSAQALTFTVLHTFTGTAGDGGRPSASLIEDNDGNLYGTTSVAGAEDCMFGCGTVFKIAPDMTETILYAFTGANRKRGTDDGAYPTAALIADASGNLYGTTSEGGDTRCGHGTNGRGCGTVFRVAPGGAETVLHQFTGTSDGAFPYARLLIGADGDLYGTAEEGGTAKHRGGPGTVFKMALNGKTKVLYAFKGHKNGSAPITNVIEDSAGNLYGTTADGGSKCGSVGCGTVFKITLDGNESVLHAFKGGSDGAFPQGELIVDGSGNLYGTTYAGGGSSACNNGCGTVFKVEPNGHESVIYAFQGGSDGAAPTAGLSADTAGNFYGTTESGGDSACVDGCGTVFEVVNGTSERMLYALTGGADGYSPVGGVIVDASGNIFGTTTIGGENNCSGGGCGVVFKLSN